MPEPQPCPNCGGIHEPGACPKEAVLKKPEKELTPEEKEERDESQKELEANLAKGWIDNAQEIINLAESKNISLDIASACQKGLEARLAQGLINTAQEIINLAESKHISLDFSKPEIASVCQKGLETSLAQGWVANAQKIINLAESKHISLDIASVCQKGLEASLAEGWVANAQEIINLAESKHISLDIAPACQKRLEAGLAQGWIDRAQEIINLAESKHISLDFSKPEIASAYQKELEASLAEGQIGAAQKIINFAESKKISLEIASACQKGLEASLAQGRIANAQEIINFAESKNISLDFASACQKAVEQSLLNNNLDQSFEINKLSPLSPEKAFTLYSHHLEKLLTELESSAPQLLVQAKKSLELFFSLFAYRQNPKELTKSLRENPFLSGALIENPRFGSKLIIKYPEFDQVSKTKIQFLFQAKKEILAQKPDLDPESLKFRQLMQEKLTSFDRNQEIVNELKKTDIDVNQWLNYQETEYFTLKTGQELVPFSERVRTPLDRLAQTIDTYAHQIKSILSEWRKDLQELEIEPASLEEDRARIKQMEEELEKARSAHDEKKVQGLSRGLEAMRQKTEKATKMPLWQRIMGEIDSFAKLKESLIKSQQDLILKEQKYEELVSSKMPPLAELTKLKSQLAQSKEDFRKRLGQLERRLGAFRINFPVLISGLGKDRAASLEQELNERMAEQFAHYDSDHQVLDSLFSEKADKEKEKLEDRPMSIFVWSRNPDLDLYQGNYSPCCICIESEHMGPESTIADYATDLGVQVVNLWDEEKNEPVAAAWCWLAKDKQGRAALVVDNIEANVSYSSNFPSELWSALRSYLEKYAKAIKADRLVLGKANNDLPTASELVKLPEAEAEYTKLGGQNSRPNGYFLEAKEKSVKLLWEKSKKAAKERVKKEKLERIELKDVLTKELTSEDFNKIIKLERQVYEQEGLVRGQEMIKDLKAKEGLNYSVTLYGKRPKQEKEDILGYLVAYQDETNEGKPCVYLDDIAIAPDCQGLGLGWNLLEKAIERLKTEAQKQGKPILFDMHLKPGSQRLFEKHVDDLAKMGVILHESVLAPDHYDEGEDALYCVYEVKMS